jgi:tripartite-type tricarboxylate transporter receptor subunit TctC
LRTLPSATDWPASSKKAFRQAGRFRPTHGVNPSLYHQLPYDPEKDFEPVGGLIRILQMMCVRSDFPADDLPGFIKVAKERAATKPLSYGTGNTSSRVAAELLKASAGVAMIDVPYRGTPQAVQDLVGGHIDMFFADPFAGMPWSRRASSRCSPSPTRRACRCCPRCRPWPRRAMGASRS